ncbi:unnamed protein product [Peronospora effusa]|nr:unnamed protein product [Peronospora effusa]
MHLLRRVGAHCSARRSSINLAVSLQLYPSSVSNLLSFYEQNSQRKGFATSSSDSSRRSQCKQIRLATSSNG